MLTTEDRAPDRQSVILSEPRAPRASGEAKNLLSQRDDRGDASRCGAQHDGLATNRSPLDR